MLEMSEIARILHHATARSFVILDEVGRGTSPADGAALAAAVTEYLHDRAQCRAMSATRMTLMLSLFSFFVID